MRALHRHASLHSSSLKTQQAAKLAHLLPCTHRHPHMFYTSTHAPRCLHPNTKSIQWCMEAEAWGPSSASRMAWMKVWGEVPAHAGS